MKKFLIVLIIICIIAGCGLGVYFGVVRYNSKKYNLMTLKAQNLPDKCEAIEDEYIQLSDVKMHYVRYGIGEQPVILIHGNGGSANSLKELAQYLANDYSVYCLDSRCQGLSSDPGIITYDLMAKDVYEFIQAKLTIKPFVLGHSDGGIVAISLASLYPNSIAACMPCGANSHPDKFKWYFTFAVKVANLFKKDKLNDLMLELPDFTPEYLSNITVPTYIVAAEYDIMPLSDTVYIHESIVGSKIAIIKAATHSSYISKNGGKIYQLAKEFFAEQEQGVLL